MVEDYMKEKPMSSPKVEENSSVPNFSDADRDLISIDAMSDQLFSCIATRCDHMLDIFVEEIIIFPADFSEDLIIRESEHLEISLIRDIGMKGSYSRNLEKLSEENCLPSEYELCMEVNNIWLELENLSQNSWCEGESESDRVESGAGD